MILRVKPSLLRGYITPYFVDDEDEFNAFSASLWAAMSLFCPELTVSGIRASSPRIKMLKDILYKYGAGEANRMKGFAFKGNISGIDEDITECGSLIPIIVLLCSTSAKPCSLSVDPSNIKSRDLFEKSAQMAEDLGADCMFMSDVLMIKSKGRKLSGGIVNTHSDYRITACCALASLFSENEISVFNAESINRVYPKFWQIFRAYGGNVYLKEKYEKTQSEY